METQLASTIWVQSLFSRIVPWPWLQRLLACGRLHSTEAAFFLLTFRPWVRVPAFLRIFLMLLRFINNFGYLTIVVDIIAQVFAA